MRWTRLFASGLLGFAATSSAMAQIPNATSRGPINIELNKLDQTDTGCRLFVIFTNDTGSDISELGFGLVLFDSQSQAHGLWELKSGTVRQGTSFTKAFSFADISCDSISRVLFNGISDCSGGDLSPDVCLQSVALTSRAGIPFGNRWPLSE